MKKLVIILIIILSIAQGYSQVNMIGSFNSVDIGRNISLTLKKDIKRHSILIGLKYNLNRIVHDNQNNMFRKRFYATTFAEHFGFNIAYQYNFQLSKSTIRPFLFYDFQFTNSHTRNLMFLPHSYDTNGDVLYKRYLEFFGPTIALEHNLGIGFTVNILERLYLYQKIGAGIVNFFNVDKRILGSGGWEFGSVISVGVGYRLKKK
ncbi:MAG: hypothetical protein D4R64_14705 [Porphyromonadaceae bacterium]|nr:MAG: hypothetical protein D4R64_14705 [Porphyromonadaceae bacterium]